MLKKCDTNGLARFQEFSFTIKRTTEGLHCGALFLRPDQTIGFIHLAWNYDLRIEDPDPRYFWLDIGLGSSGRKFMAIVAQRVATGSPKIPYGLDRSGIFFDENTGACTLGNMGKGLTCATFLICLLDVGGFNLLRENEWPKRANSSWTRSVLRSLRARGAEPDQIDGVKKDLDARRFKPSEVVASSVLPRSTWPVGFSSASCLAKSLEELI